MKELCAVLGVHRSTFYYHQKRRRTTDGGRDALKDRVVELHQLSRGAAGARTLSAMLCREGKAVGRYKAGHLMREAGVVSRQPGKHRYRVCEQRSQYADNHLKRHFRVAGPDQVWCGDITYIRCRGGWLYLAVVLDLYARKVVGWSFSGTSDSQLAQQALSMAWERRGRPSGVMFHSDQGAQYSSVPYGAMVARYGMSRRGNCWDNAVVERFFRILKTEWLRRNGYQYMEEAQRDIEEYITGYYNRIRPHRCNGGLSPAMKEIQRKLQSVS